MLVRELLELLKEYPVSVIAKERLTVGEKPTRKALKEAGAVYENGKGWHFEGNEADLERPIYDFVVRSGTRSTTKSKKKANKETSTIQTKSPLLETSTATSFKNVSQDELDKIDRLLGKEPASKTERVYRGFYFDKDIIEVIDGVKHGNKSELVNEAIRLVLKDRGLL